MLLTLVAVYLALSIVIGLVAARQVHTVNDYVTAGRHLPMAVVLAMVFGAAAFHGWMRMLSIAIPAAYVLLAILRFATAASSAAGTAGLIGMQERSMAYSFLAWVLALALYLLLFSRAENLTA